MLELLHIAAQFLHAFHIDYLIALLSALALYLRLAPLTGNFKILLYAVQGGLFLAQMYKIYQGQKAKKNQSAVSPRLFVAEVAQHYLETHPIGKQIAKQSQVDERLDAFVLKHDSEVPGNG